MVSAVGDDWLGDVIRETLRGRGVDTSGLQCDTDRPTGVAIVAPEGARGADFVIHRDAAADAHLAVDAEAQRLVAGAACVHMSSLLPASRAGEHARDAVAAVVDRTQTLVSYDVNLRPSAWTSPSSMVESALRMIALADLVKVTEEELRFLNLRVEPRTAGGRTWLITDGGAGARIVTPQLEVRRGITPAVVVDSTGAGDATLATVLDSVVGSPAARDSSSWTREEVHAALERAMKVGAHVVQQSGAMCDLSAFRADGS